MSGSWEEEVKEWFTKRQLPGKALGRGGQRSAVKGEGKEGASALAAKVRGQKTCPPREPHGAQVVLSRSGELLPRLPLAKAPWRWEGDAARSSSGSRAARHFR